MSRSYLEIHVFYFILAIPNEWRLLGQEQDGILLFSWNQTNQFQPTVTKIGLYFHSLNKLTTIYSFSKTSNCVQASIDSKHNYLACVTKYLDDSIKSFTYKAFLIYLKTGEICDLKLERSKQIFIQFLYQKHSVLSESSVLKFLILIHQECILQYEINECENLVLNDFAYESLVRKFTWAQWDPVHQILYYIHNKKPSRGLVEGEDESINSPISKISPTLSGLQFHDDLPHESVVSEDLQN